MRVRLLILAFLVSLPLLAAETQTKTAVKKRAPLEVGLFLYTLLPNGLPEFDMSLTVYGPMFAIPFGPHRLQVHATYGGTDGLSVYTLEPSFKFVLRNPFFRGFAAVGGQLFHYSAGGTSYDHTGANVAFGLIFPMGMNCEWTLIWKSYLQARTLMSFGGGFTFLL